jgi:transcriptional regulator with XRE-family HTH domain
MSNNDMRQLLQVLRDVVRASRFPARELERSLGIANGGLERLLAGETELRVRHLLAFARVFRVPVADFLELGCPESARTAEFRLADWLRSAEPFKPERQQSAGTPLPSTVEELSSLIRAAVQQELAALKPSGPDGKAS